MRYLLLGFVNVKVNASYAWGGAMLVYKKHVMKGSDPFKIRELWVNGGIQDDMVLNSCAIENGLFAANLPAAVYFNELKKDITFPFACDFIRRQVVVAGCYHSLGARARHWGMLLVRSPFGSSGNAAAINPPFCAYSAGILCSQYARLLRAGPHSRRPPIKGRLVPFLVRCVDRVVFCGDSGQVSYFLLATLSSQDTRRISDR